MSKTGYIITVIACHVLLFLPLPFLCATEEVQEKYELMDYEDFWRKGEDILPSLQELPQDSLNVRRVGRGLFEPLGLFTIDHDTCYIISGKDIVLYDVSDETAPVLLSSHRIDIINVQDIQSVGPYLYLTAYVQGFWILDKTDGFKPVGSYKPGALMTRTFIEDGRAYIIGDYNIYIVDITQPENIELLGIYDLNAALTMTYVTGDTCYVTRNSYGLMVLDVSDPGDIVALDSLRITDGLLRLTKQDTLVYATGLKHLSVINVSDITNIVDIGRTGIGDVIGTPAIQVYGLYVMIPAENTGIHIFNVSDPANMHEVGHYPVVYPSGTEYSPPYVFVTDGEGMSIIDFSTPQEPELVEFMDGEFLIDNLEAHDDIVYICDYNHTYGGGVFYLIDISEPTFPKVINSMELNGANDVQINYPLAYVGSRTTGFYILDISNPDSVVQIGHSDIDARGIFIKYPYAYLSIEDINLEGLKILDISQPDSIIELGYYPILATYDVFVQDTIAYVASAFDGVNIINVKNPEQLTRISRFPTYDIAFDVYVSGNYLYVAAGFAGVSVVNVVDPSNPVEVSYSTIPYGQQVYVVEPYLYVSGQYRGLRIFDITEPENFYEIGNYTGINTAGIYADEEYVYLGTTLSGFYIFEFTPVGIIPINKDGSPNLPKTFTLYQNYPNPFNPMTTISFDIPWEDQHVKLTVYDLRGRHVMTLMDSDLEPDNYRVIWDGRNDRGEEVSSGVYFYTIKTGDHIATRKMTVVR